MLTDRATVKTEVIFSDDRQQRYLLRKEWEAKLPKATIVMTNPSTADILLIDHTTMYIINNLVRLSYGGVDIVNLVSKPTTKIKVKEDMLELDMTNVNIILKSAEKSETVIIAWGKLGENNKKVRDIQDQLLSVLRPFADKLHEIADEKGASGFHPLAPQIRFAWILKKFEIPKKQPDKEAP